jgi:hypothetical protein
MCVNKGFLTRDTTDFKVSAEKKGGIGLLSTSSVHGVAVSSDHHATRKGIVLEHDLLGIKIAGQRK